MTALNVITSCPGSADKVCQFMPTAIREGADHVVRCDTCGLGVTLPEIDDVAALYADRESWDFQPRTAGLAAAIKHTAFEWNASQMLARLGEQPKAIIDYGCGSGLFTSCLHRIAKGEVIALDFHEEPPVDLDGPAYLPFAREGELAGHADLLLASHVLEHAVDPVELVARMAKLVKPGGMMILEVPNVDCWGATVFGSKWANWYLPFHRLHFSRASLRAVVEQAGLVVEIERDACVPSMGRTIANMFGVSNTLPFLLAGAALHPLQKLLEIVTARPSALQIICRKP